MIFDSHVHTRFSVDSRMGPEEASAAASRLGLGICAAEHVDFETDSDEPSLIDADRYFGEYASWRSESFLLGLEIGLTVNTRAAGRITAADPRLDFCIGSVHVSNGYDIYTLSLWKQNIPPEEILAGYLRYTVTAIEKCGFFDSLGHIDYPSRYSPQTEKNIRYKTYQKLFDEVFTALLDLKKTIEINTKLMYDPAACSNLYDIYEGYYNKGGRYVTLGSDAHRPESVGAHIGEAYRMAKKIGLTPVHYECREMIADA